MTIYAAGVCLYGFGGSIKISEPVSYEMDVDWEQFNENYPECHIVWAFNEHGGYFMDGTVRSHLAKETHMRKLWK